MLTLFFFLVCSTTFPQKNPTDFAVAIELIQTATKENIKLKVDVKNSTGYPVTVPKRKLTDYKREKIPANGNYVILIQKWESDSFRLFTPSADIDPIYPGEEFVTIQNGNTITDTLNISGFEFSRKTELKRGFLPGNYRIKIYFNRDMWSTSERNGSNWLECTIE